MSSVLPHLERVCARFPEGGESENSGVIGRLFQCAVATKNEAAMAALLSRLEARIHIIEILAVLDEKQLSMTQLAQQIQSPAAQQGLEKMRAVLAQAADAVRTAQEAASMDDVELLASDREHRDLAKAVLPALWKKQRNAGVLRLTARLQPEDGPDFLLEGWSGSTPTLRMQIIEALLSSDAWTVALLERIEAKQVEASACDAATRARLLKHPRKEVQKLAAATFVDSATATRAAVVDKFKPALRLTGDAAKGKAVFAQVCISCHRLDGVGMDLGPDLRSVAQHDAEKLLNSILDPSAIIEPGFTAYHCTLKNGEQLYGVVATETSASLTLKMAGNVSRAVLRSEIASLRSTGTSLMPEGLEAALTPQALADLIAYLKTGR